MSSLIDLATVGTLERCLFRAWPALHTLTTAGWIQRFANGYTKRANSINVLEEKAPFSIELRDALEQPYRTRGLPPIWRLTPLAPPEADPMLAALGYRRIEESLVQVAPLAAHFAADPEVVLASTPAPAWLPRFAELSPVAPAQSVWSPKPVPPIWNCGMTIRLTSSCVQRFHSGCASSASERKARSAR